MEKYIYILNIYIGLIVLYVFLHGFLSISMETLDKSAFFTFAYKIFVMFFHPVSIQLKLTVLFVPL